MFSIIRRLLLKTFPFTIMYMSWYVCLSIFLNSRYFRSKRRNTLSLLIHNVFDGSLASFVPFRFPYPECLPFVSAFCASRHRERERIFFGFLTMKPFFTSFLMAILELAMEISIVGLVGIEPHFSFTTFKHKDGEPLLWHQ